MTVDAEVLVVGGGPVGLFLTARLVQLGVDALCLEARADPAADGESRSIGIHPPSLACFRALGVADRFLAEGVLVRRALAFSSRGLLGTVDLTRRSGPDRFVLTLPQARTEALLGAHLSGLCPAALRRGVRVTRVAAGAARTGPVTVDTAAGALTARVVVGCDGGRSLVRCNMGVPFPGWRAPEAYVMGDFPDDTDLGHDAAIFLADAGLVESFPLPGGLRRWVAEWPARVDTPDAGALVATVAARTGHHPDPARAAMLSAFGVEQRLAPRWVDRGRVLCGDAAHLVSPFGGQGMNLGWLDAFDLAAALTRGLGHGETRGADLGAELAGYARRRRRAARRALRRGALNRRIGHRSPAPRLRNAVLGAALAGIPEATLVRLFTMGGLGGPDA